MNDVLGKSQVAAAQRWLLLNTKWGELIRNGEWSILWDSKKDKHNMREWVKRLFPTSVPGVDTRSRQVPASASRRRPGGVKYNYTYETMLVSYLLK